VDKAQKHSSHFTAALQANDGEYRQIFSSGLMLTTFAHGVTSGDRLLHVGMARLS